jgi:hypothetical protein
VYLSNKNVLPSIQIDFVSKQHFLVCAQSSALLTAPLRAIETGEPALRAAKTSSGFLNLRKRFIISTTFLLQRSRAA